MLDCVCVRLCVCVCVCVRVRACASMLKTVMSKMYHKLKLV